MLTAGACVFQDKGGNYLYNQKKKKQPFSGKKRYGEKSGT